MYINLKVLEELEKEGYITRRKHPESDFYIYNYTPKTQYDGYWTETTKICRGLILDSAGNIKARPFAKFFNIQEHKGAIPSGPFTVSEKMDGSLGIMYWLNGVPHIATRGSFESEQAKVGTSLLHEKRDLWDSFIPYHTYLFEIIYPENRIVVDYGSERKLVLLAAIRNDTGEEINIDTMPFEKPVIYHGIRDIHQLHKIEQESNKEGFVLKWENGFRLKFKFDEYVRLHRILTQTTARTIWEYLKEDRPVKEILDHVPDEFYKWVKSKVKEFTSQYQKIYGYCKQQSNVAKAEILVENIDKEKLTYSEVKQLDNQVRRKAKEYFTDFEDICWSFFYSRPKGKIKEQIWDTLYPAHEVPFKEEI